MFFSGDKHNCISGSQYSSFPFHCFSLSYSPHLKGLTELRKIDSQIIDYVASKYGVDSLPFLCFRSFGSDDGVAISSNNEGFLRFEAVIQQDLDGSKCIPLFQGIMRLIFSRGQEKVCSMEWCPFLSDVSWNESVTGGARSSNGLNPNFRTPRDILLEKQRNFPSVVSLEGNCGGVTSSVRHFEVGISTSGQSSGKLFCGTSLEDQPVFRNNGRNGGGAQHGTSETDGVTEFDSSGASCDIPCNGSRLSDNRETTGDSLVPGMNI